MIAQPITARRVFILGHGAYVDNTKSVSKENIYFYNKKGTFLDRCLIPGFFQLFDINPDIDARQLVEASRVANEYVEFTPCSSESLLNQEEHILFIEAPFGNNNMLEADKYVTYSEFEKYPNESNISQGGDIKDLRMEWRKYTVLVKNRITSQLKLDNFLELKKMSMEKISAQSYTELFQVENMPVSDMEFNIYKVQKKTNLEGDIVIVPVERQKGCIPLSSIIAWIQTSYPNTEIHWMACRGIAKKNTDIKAGSEKPETE